MVKIILPFPPSVNHYWRHVPVLINGVYVVRNMVSAEARKFKTKVRAVVLQQRAAHRISSPCRVHVLLCPKDKVRRDADNFAKATLDALVDACVLKDDNCTVVRAVTMEWGPVVKGGAAKVSIEAVGA